MKPCSLTAISLAIAAFVPLSALAQTAQPPKKPATPSSTAAVESLNKELQALKAKLAELEAKAQAAAKEAEEAKAAAASSEATARSAKADAANPSGMTVEQIREFNRIAVKTEALEDAVEAQGMKNLVISGFIDPAFVYNRAANTASFQLLNTEAYAYDNSYFGMAVLDFQKELDDGTRFKLTLAPQRGTGEVFNSSLVHEASVNIPLSDLQTRLWVGQIPDWTGYEITLSPGNKLVTHNLLFDFMAPTAYTGAVADITVGKWWSRVGFANVNSSKYLPAANGKGNRSPAFIYRVDYSKGEFNGFGFTGLHGNTYNYAADDVDGDDNFLFPDDAGAYTRTDLLELDGYFIRGDWTVNGQVSWGRQEKAAIYREDGVLRDASWWGLSALAAYKLSPRLEAVARADYVNNTKNGGGLLGYTADDGRNGIGRSMMWDETSGSFVPEDPSMGTKRYAVTLGMNYSLNPTTLIKAEVRADGSNGYVFYNAKDGSYSNRNYLLGTSVVMSF
jgi:hypothetical protein